MKNVVVLGGGFAGVRAALTLKREVKSNNIRVTFIDKNSFHTFTPSLYEVATSEESQRNIVIPYKSILGHQVEVIQGVVREIDPKKQAVILDSQKKFSYDYLIFALGSNAEYFDIPGVKEYGIPLKTLEDAVRIKKALRNAKKIVIGGGGFSGTELACELMTHKSHLEITLVAGSQILLKELGDGISILAKKRIEEGKVNLILGKRIRKVTREIVELEGGGKFPYDVFIWTGGVKSNNLLGKIEVNQALAVNNFKNVFAAGDVVCPGVARRAIKMGKIAAENILRSIEGKILIPYSYHNIGYLVPLGSHFATFAMGKYHISGIPAYILQQIVFLRYLLTIVPFFEAIKRFIRFEKDLS